MKQKAVLTIGYNRYLVDIDSAVTMAKLFTGCERLESDYDAACGFKLDPNRRMERPSIEILSEVDLTELEMSRD